MNHTNLLRQAMLRATSMGARLFLNNVGTGWTGNRIERLPGGQILIHDPRPLHSGLATGSHDLIGLAPVVIEPRHVGQTIAVFASVEGKTGKGRPTKQQRAWLQMVRDNGGYAGVARQPEHIAAILSGSTEYSK